MATLPDKKIIYVRIVFLMYNLVHYFLGLEIPINYYTNFVCGIFLHKYSLILLIIYHARGI